MQSNLVPRLTQLSKRTQLELRGWAGLNASQSMELEGLADLILQQSFQLEIPKDERLRQLEKHKIYDVDLEIEEYFVWSSLLKLIADAERVVHQPYPKAVAEVLVQYTYITAALKAVYMAETILHMYGKLPYVQDRLDWLEHMKIHVLERKSLFVSPGFEELMSASKSEKKWYYASKYFVNENLESFSQEAESIVPNELYTAFAENRLTSEDFKKNDFEPIAEKMLGWKWLFSWIMILSELREYNYLYTEDSSFAPYKRKGTSESEMPKGYALMWAIKQVYGKHIDEKSIRKGKIANYYAELAGFEGDYSRELADSSIKRPESAAERDRALKFVQDHPYMED